MSHSLEDSPISDNKMDISEATTSQGSPCFSPDTEENEPNNTKIHNLENIIKNNETKTEENERIDELNLIPTTSKYTEDDLITTKLKEIDILDNRLNNDENAGDIQETTLLNKRSLPRKTLTLVSNHPLMSPPPDSNGHEQRQIFNYPDIVPKIEQLPIDDQIDSFHDFDDNINKSDRRKIDLLSDPCPDYLSSDSETDLSQYQATVAPTLQTVALVTNTGYKSVNNFTISKKQRKISLSADILLDDVSSIDTISNHSLDDGDDDFEKNFISLSPTSSMMEDITFDDKDDQVTPIVENVEPIPQYTAAEERRDSRNWQKITLPDGKTRDIDMKVIEPYKRVLSHGGYLKAGGHNAIVVFSACHLPDRSRTDYHYVMDNLFLYVVKTLEQLVTEDYVLVYLHGGSNRGNVPPFPWLKKCYQLIDRRLRKSLKHLFLVHPTFWLKSIVWMSRPFISSKFWRKMIYCRTLEDLYKLVPVEKAAVPDKVKNFDSKFT